MPVRGQTLQAGEAAPQTGEVSGSLIALGAEQRGSAASLESLKGKTNAKLTERRRNKT